MKLAAIVLGCVLATAPTAPAAWAHDVDILPPRPIPAPGWVWRWIPAVYETLYERVWVDECITRRPIWTWDDGHWIQEWREEVVPAHYEIRARRELVTPGHWELVRVDPEPWPGPIPPPWPHPLPVVDPPTATVGVDGYARSTGGEDLSKFSGLKEWPK